MLLKNTKKSLLILFLFLIGLWLMSGRTAVGLLDGNEPNDTFDDATLVTIGTYPELTIDPYWGDYDDYYRIFLNMGDNMSVVLWNMTQDLNLEIYDTLRSYITGSSNPMTIPESVTLLQVSISGYYYIRVYSWSYTVWSYYNLNITAIMDDGFENNDDISTATTVVKGSFDNLMLADTDCYNISLTAGENLTAQVALTTGNGYFDVGLYAPNGTELQSRRSFSKGTLGNIVLRNALTAGLYSIKITQQSTYYWGNYSLLLADANDDIFEDNDGFATAADLTKGEDYTNLALFDADFYNITLYANENISISLSLSTGSGRFNMSLFDIDQSTELWYSNNIASSGSIYIAHVPSSGEYSLRILAASGDTWGNYSLTLGNLADDIFEHADSFATAQQLNKSTTTYQSLVLHDADFYKVNLTYHENVSIKCYFSSIVGSVNMSLYAPDQTTLLFQIDNVDYFTSYYYGSPTFVVSNDETTEDFYYLKIVPNEYSYCANYQINVWYAWDDSYENNDVVGSATEVVKFMTYSLALFDDDFYMLYLDAGDSARVMLTRSFGPGVFGVTIYAPDNQTIINSTANILAKSVSYVQVTSVTEAGFYIIKVRSYAGSYGNYTMLIGNVYTISTPDGGGIAGFPTEGVILFGSGCLMMIIVWNRKKSRKDTREGV